MSGPNSKTMMRIRRNLGLPPPESLLQMRQRLGLTDRQMAEALNVSLSRYQRWERADRPSRFLRRALDLFALVHRELPHRFSALIAALPRHRGAGVPKDAPEWLKPHPKPRRLSARPVGRPRRPGSQTPVRRKCVGYIVPGFGRNPCDRIVVSPPEMRGGGARLCDECRRTAIANQREARS